MGEHIFELLRMHFQHHGYWTVAVALLLENAGLPVPGETILLLASFLAFRDHHLHLGLIIVVGAIACALGDNLGYLIGHHGGRRLLDHWKHLFRISQTHLDRGERLFERFGPATIFFARFVFGMRVIAGPLAGVLRMPWKEFVIFNLLGAATWVSVTATLGYLFGRHWHLLLRTMRDFNLVVLLIIALLALALWLRYRARQGQPARVAQVNKK
jgi:membrane-associated protein